jgi:hypothetical protein
MMTGKRERLEELESWKRVVEFRDRRRAAQARRSSNGPLAELLASVPAPDPLTDRDAEEMTRLLICYLTDEIGEQRRDELLAWLDKLTVRRLFRLLP